MKASFSPRFFRGLVVSLLAMGVSVGASAMQGQGQEQRECEKPVDTTHYKSHQTVADNTRLDVHHIDVTITTKTYERAWDVTDTWTEGDQCDKDAPARKVAECKKGQPQEWKQVQGAEGECKQQLQVAKHEAAECAGKSKYAEIREINNRKWLYEVRIVKTIDTDEYNDAPIKTDNKCYDANQGQYNQKGYPTDWK